MSGHLYAPRRAGRVRKSLDRESSMPIFIFFRRDRTSRQRKGGGVCACKRVCGRRWSDRVTRRANRFAFTNPPGESSGFKIACVEYRLPENVPSSMKQNLRLSLVRRALALNGIFLLDYPLADSQAQRETHLTTKYRTYALPIYP